VTKLRLRCIKLTRLMVTVSMILSLLHSPLYAQESEDSRVFIAGFNAYKQKDYSTSIVRLNEVLQKYPDTSLRDVALFWLGRAYFKNGNEEDAARTLSRFSEEFPSSPLMETAEEELADLANRYRKGEKLAAGPPVRELEQLKLAWSKENQERRVEEKSEIESAAKERKQEEQAAAEARHVESIRREHELTASQKREEFAASAERTAKERVAGAGREAEHAKSVARGEEREAALKHEEAKNAARQAEEEKAAALKREEAKAATLAQEKKIAAEQEEERSRGEKARKEKALLREKAVAQFREVIEKYPGTTSAAVAAAKLKELGIVVAIPREKAPAVQDNAGMVVFEVARFAALEFNILSKPERVESGGIVRIPFTVTNRGNGPDSFVLESSFPQEFSASFSSAGVPGGKLGRTSSLEPGASFNGLLELTVPPGSIDGLKIAFPVKVASAASAEATQSRVISFAASAPMLRAVIRADKSTPLPGEMLNYRISIMNLGSIQADNVSVLLNIPPQLRLSSDEKGRFRQLDERSVVLEGLQIKPGENRETGVALQVKPDAMAGQELFILAGVTDKKLNRGGAFVSNTSLIGAQRGVAAKTAGGGKKVIPGEKLRIPLLVTNTGNIREKYRIAPENRGISSFSIFNDLNRDGKRDPDEPETDMVGPLEPGEEASVVMEVGTLAGAADGVAGKVSVTFISDADASKSASVSSEIIYSRPVLSMKVTGRNKQLKPGEITAFDLVVSNDGSNLARLVELTSNWPEQFELIASQPQGEASEPGKMTWSFRELGSGEKRNITVSFRVRPGTGLGSSIQVNNTLRYEDQAGNRY